MRSRGKTRRVTEAGGAQPPAKLPNTQRFQEKVKIASQHALQLQILTVRGRRRPRSKRGSRRLHPGLPLQGHRLLRTLGDTGHPPCPVALADATTNPAAPGEGLRGPGNGGERGCTRGLNPYRGPQGALSSPCRDYLARRERTEPGAVPPAAHESRLSPAPHPPFCQVSASVSQLSLQAPGQLPRCVTSWGW